MSILLVAESDEEGIVLNVDEIQYLRFDKAQAIAVVGLKTGHIRLPGLLGERVWEGMVAFTRTKPRQIMPAPENDKTLQ